jgi:hypothetical protein
MLLELLYLKGLLAASNVAITVVDVQNKLIEFSEIKNKNLVWLIENDILDKEYEHFIFPLKEVFFREFNFAPFLKNLLKV